MGGNSPAVNQSVCVLGGQGLFHRGSFERSYNVCSLLCFRLFTYTINGAGVLQGHYFGPHLNTKVTQ